jgi:hypothetical protein
MMMMMLIFLSINETHTGLEIDGCVTFILVLATPLANQAGLNVFHSVEYRGRNAHQVFVSAMLFP